MRTNGFQRPFHHLQVISWVAFALFIAGWPAFFAPALPAAGVWGASAVYAALVLVLVSFAGRTTSSNPVDAAVPIGAAAHRDESPAEMADRQHMSEPGQLWCPDCNEHVHRRV
jgi:hypothetical protein